MQIINKIILNILIGLTCLVSTNAFGQKITSISGNIKSLANQDSVELYLDNNDDIANFRERYIKLPLKDGYFHYRFLLGHATEFVIRYKKEQNYFIEPGDSIVINESNDSTIISGKGDLKNKVLLEAEGASRSGIKEPYSRSFSSCDSLGEYLDFSRWISEIQSTKLTIINKYKGQLTADAYAMVVSSSLFGMQERYRLSKFFVLLQNAKKFKLSTTDLRR